MIKKITEEQKKEMRVMRKKGETQAFIAGHFGVCLSTVQYHLSSEQREKAINRAMRNQRPRPPRTDYMRDYMKNRRKSDPEFAERLRDTCRKAMRKQRDKGRYIN